MILYLIVFQISEAESIQYLAKASQSLGQALDLALKCGDKVNGPCCELHCGRLYMTTSACQWLAEMAALTIVDTCGTCDARTAALHLALFQVYTYMFQEQTDL